MKRAKRGATTLVVCRLLCIAIENRLHLVRRARALGLSPTQALVAKASSGFQFPDPVHPRGLGDRDRRVLPVQAAAPWSVVLFEVTQNMRDVPRDREQLRAWPISP